MANKKVCDFCLTEYKGLFNRPEQMKDGYRVCANCRSIIEQYKLPLRYDLFQKLVTAQPNMRDMIMDAFLENGVPDDTVARFYPLPSIPLHDGEHCINSIPATIIVNKERIPEEDAVTTIMEIRKKNINNIPDANSRKNAVRIEGTLIETEAALYFMSEKFINCHRLGYILRNREETDRIAVVTPNYTYTYLVKNADMFFYRERFFQKVGAAKSNKTTHLIYIKNDNEITITPGVYDIPKSIRPGIYKVKAIDDAGLHIRDSLGRVKDYYENEESIDLADGGVLECTGEYQLTWIGENKTD